MTSKPYPPSQLGYFLAPYFWSNAIKLLNYQIELKKKGYKHFKKLSMFYYERLGDSTKKLTTPTYFKKKVASSLFYGLENEFRIFAYTVPKWSSIGVRNYKFFTYPMRVLHYAVGLYLLQLSQEFLKEFVGKIDRIYSYYGGELWFEDNTDQLRSLKREHVYFLNYYREFRKNIKHETEENPENKLVMRLDIQNYFDELPISTLLRLLSEYIKPSIQKEMNYDESTRDQLVSFYTFMAGKPTGIPQSDNDIVASFIGYLYLVFGDMFIDEEIVKDKELVESHKIIRYMDDIFVSIQLKPDLPVMEVDNYAESLAHRFAEILYTKLNLKLNLKTRFYRLGRPEEVAELLDALKSTSPEYEVGPIELEGIEEAVLL